MSATLNVLKCPECDHHTGGVVINGRTILRPECPKCGMDWYEWQGEINREEAKDDCD